jgi:hypothetical protein
VRVEGQSPSLRCVLSRPLILSPYLEAQGAVYEGRFREDAMDGQGTVKINRALPGSVPGEIFIPFEIQADIRRIHYRAGFGADSH